MKLTPYLLILTLAILSSCSSADKISDAENNKIEQKIAEPVADMRISKDITASEFKNLIAIGNVQLVDVRTPEEFEAGTIENAENINFLSDNFAAEILKLNPEIPVLVFCRSGGRSSKAKTQISESGFTEVYNLVGGYEQWSKN